MHRDQYEFEYGRTVRLHLDALLVPVQIIFSPVHSQRHIFILFFMLSQDRTFVLHLDIPSWDRVEEESC